jgi:adenylyl-sulfate kinase
MDQSVSPEKITPAARAARNGHRGATVWLTGLSGAGKSTLSRALEQALFAQGRHVYVLDGDELRHGLNASLGYSRADRQENIRRVAELSRILSDAGLITISAFISPFREDRQKAREISRAGGISFVEVYVNAPLAVCEDRDTKGLYRRARAGEIPDFTGIGSPYEPPLEPEVAVCTHRQTVAECVDAIIDYLHPLLTVSP